MGIEKGAFSYAELIAKAAASGKAIMSIKLDGGKQLTYSDAVDILNAIQNEKIPGLRCEF